MQHHFEFGQGHYPAFWEDDPPFKGPSLTKKGEKNEIYS